VTILERLWNRREKLGISTMEKRIDGFFQDYLDYVRFRTSPNTVK